MFIISWLCWIQRLWLDSYKGDGSISISNNRVILSFTPILILSGRYPSNLVSYVITFPFKTRSKILSSLSKCVLMVILCWSHIMALYVADSQERHWCTVCDKECVWTCGIGIFLFGGDPPCLCWYVKLFSFWLSWLFRFLWGCLLHKVCGSYIFKHPIIYAKVSWLGKISIFILWSSILGIVGWGS